jgi:predicted transcriptional regulator
MPSVQLQQDTLAALERIAARRGSDLPATVEAALSQFIALEELTDEQYQRAWDILLREIRAGVPRGITPDEIEADIDAATDEVWAERRARSR